jgi:hypothetical protein
MSVTQEDIFKLLLENSKNGQAQISRVDVDTSVFADICGDHKGNLFSTSFRYDEINLNISFKMKRSAFIEVNELLSRVM